MPIKQSVGFRILDKARTDAAVLHKRLKIDKDGTIWRLKAGSWKRTGMIFDVDEREDYLLSNLTQIDR